MAAHPVTVRAARADDVAALAELFLSVRAENVPAIPPVVHPPESVAPWLAHVVSEDTVWVADDGGTLVAFLALAAEGEVDQLYVRAASAGRGLGADLLGCAKALHPQGLGLWTFAANHGARRFYARHGFVEVGGTDGDNEEGAPDVRMEWRTGPRGVSAGGWRR